VTVKAQQGYAPGIERFAAQNGVMERVHVEVLMASRVTGGRAPPSGSSRTMNDGQWRLIVLPRGLPMSPSLNSLDGTDVEHGDRVDVPPRLEYAYSTRA
jgi:hypothetical protein